MNEMRKLLESVKPLFESSGAEQVARELVARGEDSGSEKEIMSAMYKITQEWDMGKYIMNGDFPSDVFHALRNVKGMGEEVTMEGNSDAEYELEEILGQLKDLSKEATMIARQHYPRLYSKYESYGAFNFGDSDNPYDTTFAKFVKEALEGDGEEEDY